MASFFSEIKNYFFGYDDDDNIDKRICEDNFTLRVTGCDVVSKPIAVIKMTRTVNGEKTTTTRYSGPLMKISGYIIEDKTVKSHVSFEYGVSDIIQLWRVSEHDEHISFVRGRDMFRYTIYKKDNDENGMFDRVNNIINKMIYFHETGNITY